MADETQWKARGDEVAAVITSRTGKQADATLYRRDLSGGARAARAVQVLALCWALAIVTMFIPVAHFFLVPAFLLGGPIAAWVRHRPRSLVLGGLGRCPACDEALRVRQQPEVWPLPASCESCMEALEIHRSTRARAGADA